MSERIVFLYRLRDGVNREEYERWVRESDLPFVRRRPTVLGYVITRVSGRINSEEAPPYSYAEIVDVTNVEADQANAVGPEAERLLKEWSNYVSDYLILRGEPLESFKRA